MNFSLLHNVACNWCTERAIHSLCCDLCVANEQRKRIYSRTDFPSLSISFGVFCIFAKQKHSSCVSILKRSIAIIIYHGHLFWSCTSSPWLFHLSVFWRGVLCPVPKAGWLMDLTGLASLSTSQSVSCNQKNVIISLFGVRDWQQQLLLLLLYGD